MPFPRLAPRWRAGTDAGHVATFIDRDRID
jgi:hypothetical protein